MMDKRYYPRHLFLRGYKYDKWYKKDEIKSKSHLEETSKRVKLGRQKEDDEDLSYMSALEGDNEAKEGKGLKILLDFQYY